MVWNSWYLSEYKRIKGSGKVEVLPNVLLSALVQFGCFSSQMMYINFKISKFKVCVMIALPREVRFWNDLDKALDRVGNGYRLCVMVDQPEWMDWG